MDNPSSKFWLFLVFGLFLVLVGAISDDVLAAEKTITSKSISYETTAIIEFTNNGEDDIHTIVISVSDTVFTSFKPQNDWTSPIASAKSITFVTFDPLKNNETVKFGIKTETVNPFLQWKAFDKDKILLETGIALSEDIPSFLNPIKQKSADDPVILSNSTFKIVPANPYPGATIRVTGDDFAPNSSLTLFSVGERSKSFVTDENGFFMFTMKIPEDQKPEKVNFILKDDLRTQKTLGVLISKIESEPLRNFEFVVSDIESKFDRNESVEFSGIANPDSPVLIKIMDSENNPFSTDVQNPDSNGDWSAEFSFLPTTPTGIYSAEITDGENTITKYWNLVTSKQLQVVATKPLFKSDEFMTFRGTAVPNEPIYLTLVDPQGNSVLSQNFIVHTSGFFEIKYPTTSLNLDGTYVFYAFQNSETDFIFVGLNDYPQKIISAQLNNVNYVNDDVAILGITGDNFQDLTLSIIDANDREQFTDKIELDPNGKRNYSLNLSSFSPGLYTALVSMASLQASDEFTVDLKSSHIPINLSMVKTMYYPGDFISVTGTSQPLTKIHLFLVDPDGAIINEKDTFIDENGNMITTHFLIPYDELFGKWIITVESGLNSENFEFQVNSLDDEGFVIRVTDIISSAVGKFVIIEGVVPEEQTVRITIDDPDGITVYETTIDTTDTGEFDLLWTAPSDAVGTYSVTVTDIYTKAISTVIEF